MKICVLGLGVIGLPTALLLAKNGFEVVGIDIDDRLVNLLKRKYSFSRTRSKRII